MAVLAFLTLASTAALKLPGVDSLNLKREQFEPSSKTSWLLDVARLEEKPLARARPKAQIKAEKKAGSTLMMECFALSHRTKAS